MSSFQNCTLHLAGMKSREIIAAEAMVCHLYQLVNINAGCITI